MKKGDVLVLDTDGSFSWNNGFFIVLDASSETELRLCKLNKMGEPQKFDDGRFMTTCVNPQNPDLYVTKLKFKDDEKPKELMNKALERLREVRKTVAGLGDIQAYIKGAIEEL